MIVTYEDVIPSLILNTTMYKKFFDGVHKVYAITPAEGYVLHDNGYDSYFDPELGMEVTEPILGFTRGTSTCAANYDFTANPREFYAVPANTVPEDQIFGGVGNNDHRSGV